MKHTVQHDLDIPTSKKATNKAIEAYQERFAKYEPKLTWNTDTKAALAFTVKGMSVTGDIELKPGAIDVDIDVPFLLKPFKSAALEVIEKEIQKWVAKAKAGEI